MCGRIVNLDPRQASENDWTKSETFLRRLVSNNVWSPGRTKKAYGLFTTMENVAPKNETQRKACIVCHKEYSGEISNCPVDGVVLTVLEVPRDPMVGTLFCDRFQITEVLGGGGMGMVYRATHLMMQRSVAIKILHTKMIGNADALKRFKVEAHAASNFSHPNILNVHDFGVSNQGQPYMVMDFLEGINLTALLDAEKHISVSRAINMFLQMSSALAHAHSKEIIHRDVKPSNIMLVEFEGRRDFVKLVDFGIAKVLNPSTPEAENLTRTGEVFGSPLYMSPEQCQGKKLDARADIYSLGAVMYRVVSGKPIFESTDPLETMFRQVSEMPAGFAKACPELQIPSRLETVIFKCLAKDRDHRYQSMNELRDDLELAAAEIKSQSKTTAPLNTIPLEAERFAAQDLNAGGWLNDLSENTGALPIDRTVITDNLTNPHAGTPAAGCEASAPPIPPAPADVNTGSNNFSFSMNSEVNGTASAATMPPPASQGKVSSAVDKRDETISIVVNRKSVAIGSAALVALLGIAGFLLLRPSGSPAPAPGSAASVPKFVPDSQFSSITPTPTIEGAHLNPAKTVAPPVVSKRAVTAKKKAPKRKPNQQKWQDYSPTASGRSSSYSSFNRPAQRNYSYPSSTSSSSSSYSYQTPAAAQPVVQTAPSPPIQPSTSYTSTSRTEQYATRYANRYADRGLGKVTNSKPGRRLKGWLNRGIGIIKDIAD